MTKAICRGFLTLAMLGVAEFAPLPVNADDLASPLVSDGRGTVAPPVFGPATKPGAMTENRADVLQAAARIDALVVAGLTKAGQKANPPASDEQLVRRLYVNIAGRIPTAAETVEFLKDQSPDKRAKLIDRLLLSDGYNSSMFNWLGDLLRVEDDYGKGAKTYVYEEWLKDQIAGNRPWDGLVRDLLTATGRLTTNGPVGYLLRDRGMPLDSLSNTLTLFLGANVACAQCHDHPLATWKQRDFYEMASFFGATEVGDRGANKLKSKGVEGGLKKGTMSRLLTPNLSDVENLHRNKLKFPKDYKYPDARPGDAVKPTLMTWAEADAKNPAYVVDASSPEKLREQFASWITHPQNPRFATAIANRLWKRIFGLAVQEPVTDLDDLTKGANPELLAQLADEMRRVKFDLKEFQRILLNTAAFGREVSDTPDPAKGPYLFPGPVLRRMTAEQTWDSVLVLVVGPDLDQFKLRRADEIRRLDIPAHPITAEAFIAKAKELNLQDAGKRKKKVGNIGGKSAGVEVSPDEYEGNRPAMFLGLTLARASELPQPTREAHFLRMFGQSDRQLADGSTLEGGVPQVLMLMNGVVQKVIASNQSLVLREVANLGTSQEKVRSLYFSFLGRYPTDDETQTFVQSLADGMTLGNLTWVLFNSREFIFVQ